MSVLGEMLEQDLEKVLSRMREAAAKGDVEAWDTLRDQADALSESIAEVRFEEFAS